MKLLITGGTGFIGKRLVKKLLETENNVVLLSRNKDAASAFSNKNERVSVFQWNPLTKSAPPEAFKEVDAIINLMGENIASGRWTKEKKEAIRNSRIIGTRNLLAPLEAMKEKPKKLISASATGFYGNSRNEKLTETSAVGEGFLANTCAKWEEEANRGRALGLDVTCIRFGIVLGQKGGALQKMLLPFKLGLGGKIGSGKQWMSWIYINDLIRLILFSLKHNTPPVLNGVSPYPVSNSKFTQILSNALHRPALLSVPAFALQLALGEMSELLLEGEEIYPEKTLETGFQFCYPHLTDALKHEMKR